MKTPPPENTTRSEQFQNSTKIIVELWISLAHKEMPANIPDLIQPLH